MWHTLLLYFRTFVLFTGKFSKVWNKRKGVKTGTFVTQIFLFGTFLSLFLIYWQKMEATMRRKDREMSAEFGFEVIDHSEFGVLSR